MSLTPKADMEIALTSEQINAWPDAEKTLGLVRRWPAGCPMSFSTPPMERTVPICRRLARLWLDSEQIHDENTRYIILLVTSELITNAIQHSVSERIVGRLWRTGSVLFVEIRDQGGTSSVPRVDRVDESRDHGRGLELVAKLVRGWGRQFGADGSCAVWAAVLLTSGARSEMNGNN